MVLNLEGGWFFNAPLRLLRAGMQYSRFAWLSGKGIAAQFCGLRSHAGRLFWLVMLPVGAVLFGRDRLQFPTE